MRILFRLQGFRYEILKIVYNFKFNYWVDMNFVFDWIPMTN